MLLTFYTFINNQARIFAMMKQSKIAILAIIIIIPLVSVILWSDENTKNLENTEDEIQVYVSFYPLYETTQAIIGQKADVKILTPPNVDPHDFDPSIKVIQEMKTADLIVLNGGGFESWISNMELDSDQLLDSSNGISFLKTESVDHHEEHDEHAKEDEHDDDSHTEEFYEEVASVIEEFEHGHMTEIQSVKAIEEILHEHEGDEHGHGTGAIEDIEHLLHEIEDGHIEGSHGIEEIHHLVSGEDVHDEHDEHEMTSDPHIWLNPNLVKTQVKNIAERLSKIDPENSKSYNENASQYIEKLELLDLQIREELSSCSKKDFITYHNAFSYFSNEYGLTQHTITKGVHDHSQPTAKSIEGIIDLAKKLDIKVIFTEDTSDIRNSQVIADEIGADVLILSPLATKNMENKNYFERTQENVSNLKEALCN